MKKILKLSLLYFIFAVSFTACHEGKKPVDSVDTTQVDSSKADESAVKPDTLHADSIKKLNADSSKKIK